MTSEGRGRDGVSVVVLETVYTLVASGGQEDVEYGQKGMAATGHNAGRAKIDSEH